MADATPCEGVCNASGQNPDVCGCRSIPRCGRVAARIVGEAEGRSRARRDHPALGVAAIRGREQGTVESATTRTSRCWAGRAPNRRSRCSGHLDDKFGERRRGYLLFCPAFLPACFLPRLLTRFKIARSFLTSFAVKLAASADGNAMVCLPTFTSSRAVTGAGAAFVDFDDFATFDGFDAFREVRLAGLRSGAAFRAAAGAVFLGGRRVAFRDGAATGSSGISSSAGESVRSVSDTGHLAGELMMGSARNHSRHRTWLRYFTITRAWLCHFPPGLLTSSHRLCRPAGASYSKS